MQHAITSENRPVETKVGYVQLLQRYLYWQVMLKNIELCKSIPRNSLPIHTIPFGDMSQLTQEVQNWSPVNKRGNFNVNLSKENQKKKYTFDFTPWGPPRKTRCNQKCLPSWTCSQVTQKPDRLMQIRFFTSRLKSSYLSFPKCIEVQLSWNSIWTSYPWYQFNAMPTEQLRQLVVRKIFKLTVELWIKMI